MKVRELIDALGRFDPDADVYCSESGLDWGRDDDDNSVEITTTVTVPVKGAVPYVYYNGGGEKAVLISGDDQ